MEIERKFLIKQMPDDLTPYQCHAIEQGYLTTNPVVRVRKDNSDYYLTYKGKGHMVREEYNLPLTKEAYESLIKKTEGNIITKKRYEIPYQHYIIELDLFEDPFTGITLAEVEFQSEKEALEFCPPAWFGDDVTNQSQYHNSNMSKKTFL